jgi:hypothetical protein
LRPIVLTQAAQQQGKPYAKAPTGQQAPPQQQPYQPYNQPQYMGQPTPYGYQQYPPYQAQYAPQSYYQQPQRFVPPGFNAAPYQAHQAYPNYPPAPQPFPAYPHISPSQYEATPDQYAHSQPQQQAQAGQQPHATPQTADFNKPATAQFPDRANVAGAAGTGAESNYENLPSWNQQHGVPAPVPAGGKDSQPSAAAAPQQHGYAHGQYAYGQHQYPQYGYNADNNRWA